MGEPLPGDWSVLIPYLETSHETPRPRRFEVEYKVEADDWVGALKAALDRFNANQSQEYHSWVCSVMEDALQVRDLKSGRLFQVAPAEKDREELLDLVGAQLAPAGEDSPEAQAAAVKHLAALERAASALAAAKKTSDAALAVLDAGMAASGAESASVLLFTRGRKSLKFVAARGPKAAEVLRFRLKPGQGIAGWCALRGETLAIDEARRDARFYGKVSEALGYETRSLLCAPVRRGGKVLGVIELLNKPSDAPFTPAEVRLGEALAFLLALYLPE